MQNLNGLKTIFEWRVKTSTNNKVNANLNSTKAKTTKIWKKMKKKII